MVHALLHMAAHRCLTGTRLLTLQPPHGEARVPGEGIEKRRQTTDCAERADKGDDIDGVYDAAPIGAHGDSDSLSHGIRATFIGAASLSGRSCMVLSASFG
jgi:hypothetical protein